MFDLREFVMTTIKGMIGNEADYKVREYALGWLDRKPSVLSGDDLLEIDVAIEAYHSRPPESEPMPEILPGDGTESVPEAPTEPEVSNPTPDAEASEPSTTEPTENSAQ